MMKGSLQKCIKRVYKFIGNDSFIATAKTARQSAEHRTVQIDRKDITENCLKQIFAEIFDTL